MISEKTLMKLATIFSEHALTLRDNEIQKKVLVRNKDFVLLNLFERVDNNDKNYITSLDLVEFMRDSKVIISESDAYAVIAHYDLNKDGQLSYIELYNYGVNKNKLSHEIEYGFVRVIEREIEALKMLEKQKQSLLSQCDWSSLAAFRAIDEYQHGTINNDNLRCFLRKYEVSAKLEEEDITNLIRCYDKNVDRAWNFKEFITATTPLLQYSVKAKDLHKVQIDVSSPQVYQDTTDYEKEQNYKTNMRSGVSQKTSTTALTSPKSHKYHEKENSMPNARNVLTESLIDADFSHKDTSFFKAQQNDTIMNYGYDFDKESPQNNENLHFQENLYQKSKSHTQQFTQPLIKQEGYEEKTQLARAFVDMMEIEGIQEKKRRDLALRTDFNIFDAFKLFNSVKNHKRGIDCDDMYYVLKEVLGLSITNDEVFILFYKIDRDRDGFINYSELSNCFIPKQHEYAILIQSRQPYYGEFTSPKEYFKGNTKEFLKRHIRGMIDCEVSIELIKQKIQNKERLNSDAAFKALDIQGKNQITLEDFRSFLKSCDLFPIERELQLVFERFDKDEDGIISYHEFIAGMTPFMNNAA